MDERDSILENSIGILPVLTVRCSVSSEGLPLLVPGSDNLHRPGIQKTLLTALMSKSSRMLFISARIDLSIQFRWVDKEV